MRIVLTSVLKPVTDPRLLARYGRTLAELPGAEVHIVAHVAADAPTARPDTLCPNVLLHPLFDFPRLSLNRALAGQRLLRKLRELRPDVLVIGAAELLAAGLQWQRRTRGKLVYDVRENYALNVRTQGIFPPLIASALAARIERVEAAAAPHLVGALLAERVYAEQLPWLADCRRVVIIENKYQPTSPIPVTPPPPVCVCDGMRLLITGTLSELYGTFDAIEAVATMLTVYRTSRAELRIVGYAAQAADAARLRVLAAHYPWLQLEGIERPVPHTVITEAIRWANICLLPYRRHPSFEGCIPTKLWEYLGEARPIVATGVNGWQAAVEQHQGNMLFGHPSPYQENETFADSAKSILHLAMFYEEFVQNLPPPQAFWATEAARLLAFFRALP